MHELGVVFHIIDSLEEVAKENDVTQIQSVTIEIGEVSTVILTISPIAGNGPSKEAYAHRLRNEGGNPA